MEKKFPTWKYRYFRLRFIDVTYLPDDRDRWWGIAWYPEGARFDWKNNVQLGIMTGRKEYIFDLWRKNENR